MKRVRVRTDAVRARERAWEKRNPEKKKEKYRKWAEGHPRGDYFRQWRRAHPWLTFGYKLKQLKPEDSLFTVFVALDATPKYESHFMIDRDTPLSLLIEKEETQAA